MRIRKPSRTDAVSDHGDRGDAFIQTASGIAFWPLDPRPSEVRIEDIAYALAQEIRFGNHSNGMCVAHHSVLVSRYCNPEDALFGLLHDGAEAFLGDIPRPLKHLPAFAPYREAEKRLMQVICQRFGLPEEQPLSVTKADRMVLAAEVRDIMTPLCPGWSDYGPAVPERIRPWSRKRSYREFLTRFGELWLARNVKPHLTRTSILV